MIWLPPALDWLEQDGQALARSCALVFMRCGAIMALLPGPGDRHVPLPIRLGMALALTVLVVPALPPLPWSGPAGLLSEAINGLILGAGLRLLMNALHTAGAIAGQSTSLSQIMGGAGPEPMPVFSNLLGMAAVALICAADLHLRLIEFVLLSTELLPVGQLPSVEATASWGVGRVAHAMALAFSLAAPFLVTATLYNVALGAMNRTMPSLMVSFIGVPAITLGSLALLAITAPVMLGIWMQAWHQALSAPLDNMVTR